MHNETEGPARLYRPGLWRFVVLVFAGLAIAYSGRGCFLLLRGNSGKPDDFLRRWRETRYVLLSKNPYDVLFTLEEKLGHHPPTSEFRHIAAEPEIGALDTIGYPPWTYFTGVLIHSLSPRWARLQFWLANLLALTVLSVWAFKQASPDLPSPARWFVPLAMLGTMPFWCTLTYGQYGVLLLAIAASSISLSAKGSGITAGLLIAMAMLKPSCALPFGLVLLCRRDWKAIATAAVYLSAGGLLVCYWTHTSPPTFLLQMQADGARYLLDAPSLLKAAVGTGIPLHIAEPALILIFLIATASWLVSLRGATSPLDQLAVAGFAARVFTYHRPYDDLLIVFLLLALMVRWLNHPAHSLTAAVLMVGLSLWLPLGFGWKWPFAAAQHICWVWGMIALTRDIRLMRAKPVRRIHFRSRATDPAAQPFETPALWDSESAALTRTT